MSSPTLFDNVVLGQGLAGSALAWELWRQGESTLIIDSGRNSTASKIAAGLVMPISGRRLVEVPDYQSLMQQAESHYRYVETVTGQTLFTRQFIERRFVSVTQRDDFQQRLATFRTNLEQLEDGSGFVMQGARLNVPRYLELTKQHFQNHVSYVQQQLNLEADVEVTHEGVAIPSLNIRCRRIYFCQGFEGASNPWFPAVPDRPVRGEILKVKLKRPLPRVLCTEFWLAPAFCQTIQTGQESDSDNEWLVGATYDRQHLNAGPTEEARTMLLRFVRDFTGEEASVLDHYSGVRASTANRQLVVRQHPEYSHVMVVNGLGSRGTLLAPIAAERAIGARSSKSGSRMTKPPQAKSVTQLVHNIHRRLLRMGDRVLDATAGNGHDTLFLAKLVGAKNVTAIDQQQEALESAKARLGSENLSGVEWIHGDHAQKLSEFEKAHRRFRAIVFNLGYLPGGDRKIVTQRETTLRAIDSAERLLEPGGVMTVIAYPGHDAGKDEETALRTLIESRADTSRPIDRIPGNEHDPKSPVLYVFRA